AALTANLSTAGPPNARADLEELAGQLDFLAGGSNPASHFSLSGVPKDMAKKYLQQVARLTERKYEVKDLIALLEHGNPRVRPLAAAALSARGDPKLLPHLVALANDRAETFPEPAPSAVPVELVNPKKGPTLDKRTVGQRVSLMVQEYLSPAG